MRLKLIVWVCVNRGKYKAMIATIQWACFFLYKGLLIIKRVSDKLSHQFDKEIETIEKNKNNIIS
jgi:hypothetical protein